MKKIKAITSLCLLFMCPCFTTDSTFASEMNREETVQVIKVDDLQFKKTENNLE